MTSRGAYDERVRGHEFQAFLDVGTLVGDRGTVMKNRRSLFGRLFGRRRSGKLASVRQELQRRGVATERISDGELEAAISDGQRVLGSASVRGSDVTGAFVVLVRSQEKL
jgi:hypothetical protein